MHRSFIHFITSFACSVFLTLPLRAHDHLAAGVVDTNGNLKGDPGEKLKLFGVPTPTLPGVPVLTFQLQGRTGAQLYAGYHVLDENSPNGFSFISKSLQDSEGPAPNANVQMQIASVTGPEGGNFGFWEAEGDDARVLFFSTPSNVFAANQPTGDFLFPVSEHISGDPDPVGHIHYRAWTVDQPGTYDVTFRLVDVAGQNAASFDYIFRFVAVPEPGAMLLLGSGALLLAGRRRR